MNIKIRPAGFDDIYAIRDIYNEAVLKTTATFDTEPKSLMGFRAWMRAHRKSHPVVVADDEGQVVGWASLSRYSDRAAYDGTAELSVYVRADYRGKGVGRKLMAAILQAGRRAGLHSVLSRITADNPVSLHLHEALGFRHVGVMKEVGEKFGRLLDVVIMQIVF